MKKPKLQFTVTWFYLFSEKEFKRDKINRTEFVALMNSLIKDREHEAMVRDIHVTIIKPII